MKTHHAVAGMLMLLLGGCAVQGQFIPRPGLLGVNGPADGDTYTRAEIDAINARSECRLLARTVVQIYRCEVR